MVSEIKGGGFDVFIFCQIFPIDTVWCVGCSATHNYCNVAALSIVDQLHNWTCLSALFRVAALDVAEQQNDRYISILNKFCK